MSHVSIIIMKIVDSGTLMKAPMVNVLISFPCFLAVLKRAEDVYGGELNNLVRVPPL